MATRVKSNPDNYGTHSLLVALDDQEAGALEDIVRNAALLEQGDDQGSYLMPDLVQGRAGDTVRSLDRELEPSVPGLRMGPGVRVVVEVGTVQEFGRVVGDAIPVVLGF